MGSGRLALLLALVAAMGCETPAPPPPASPPAPASLFEANEPIFLTVTAPLRELNRDRDRDKRRKHEGTVRYEGPNGPIELDVQIRTRGRYRLQRDTCSFPPLRIRFPKKQPRASAFRGQRGLKLVTHCRRSHAHDQVLLREYLTYRSYNLLTERSFRVRLAWIRYVDSEAKTEPIERYAFFLEDDDDVAERNGRELIEVESLEFGKEDLEAMSLFEVFQLMIGNTDWASYYGPPGELCCHNAVLIGDGGPIIPVPYDFDFSGVVDAPYASPNPKLPIRSVRQRLYRGVCKPRSYLEGSFAHLNAHREEIYALYRSQFGLEPRTVERVLAYYDEFFELINDPRQVERKLIDNCRDPS